MVSNGGTEITESFLTFSSDGRQAFSAPLRIAAGEPEQGFQRCFDILAGAGDRLGRVWNTPDSPNDQAKILSAGAQLAPPQAVPGTAAYERQSRTIRHYCQQLGYP